MLLTSFETKAVRCAALALAAAVAACSGGGGDDDGGGAAPPSGWVAGSFLPAASFAGKCVNPRSGTNPQSGLPYNETRGTASDENNWLRSWSNDLYLWYNEIPDRDPGLYATPDYFRSLKTPAITSSGREKDRFHFTYPTSVWLTLESGAEVSYGAVWVISSLTPPRRISVAYTHPGSAATAIANNLRRGEEIVSIDGVDIVDNLDIQAVNAVLPALYPSQPNENHFFTLRNPTTGAQRTVRLYAGTVTIDAVQNVSTLSTPTGSVGYIHFTDHLSTAEQDLIDAFGTLVAQKVTDLVLDIRYNGGGRLAIASQVAYMIAGRVPTDGRDFERLEFNDKHRSINPVTGGALTPMPFYSVSSSNQPLPTLNLSRVFLLTGSMTCSASESIINGLRGVSVQVIQIGSTTCGKPYGFYPKDNCGTTYFTIQLQGVNDVGFGGYGDGFAPQNTATLGGERLPGCSVRDDFSRALGDPLEARFASALEYRRTQGMACPVPSGVGGPAPLGFTKPFGVPTGEVADGVVEKPPWLTNRILEPQ